MKTFYKTQHSARLLMFAMMLLASVAAMAQTLTASGEPTGLIWQFDAVPFENATDEFRVTGIASDGSAVTDVVRFSRSR